MRTLSSDMLKAIHAQETGEAILCLVTIEEDSLSEPIRVTSDDVDTPSNGNTFVPFPFEYTFPDQGDDADITASLRISNVDRQIVQAIRNATDFPIVTTQFVLGSSPSTIEAEFPDFKMSNIRYDQMTVEGNLTLESPTNAAYPQHRFTPGRFPGLF